MAKTSLGIAVAFLAAMTTVATAQGPSQESRGYGGPLYVGPNFKSGEQHGPPVYGLKSSSTHHKKKRTYQATHSRKARTTAGTAKRALEKSGVESENSSIARASSGADATPGAKADVVTPDVKNENSSISRATLETGSTSKESAAEDASKTTKNIGCKNYFPTAGMTLSVPCG
jgi:hypothetical protein